MFNFPTSSLVTEKVEIAVFRLLPALVIYVRLDYEVVTQVQNYAHYKQLLGILIP